MVEKRRRNRALEIQIELRGREPLGICEHCNLPIWDRANHIAYEDDVMTHAGICGPDGQEDRRLSAPYLKQEIENEFNLLAVTNGQIGSARLELLVQNLEIYEVDDPNYGVKHWVWAKSAESAINLTKEWWRANYRDMPLEDELKATRAKPENLSIEHLRWANEGRQGFIGTEVLQAVGCEGWLGSSEFG